MTKASESPEDTSDPRDIGFHMTKEIFMMNALVAPKDIPAPKRVLILEEYEDKQSNLCLELAVKFLKDNGINVAEEKCMKSHCIIGQTIDKTSRKLYFHSNFSANIDHERSVFFAEISGYERPEQVVHCSVVTNGVIDNCMFCTGMKHPKVGDFFGRIQECKQTYSRKRKTVSSNMKVA